MKNKPQFRIGLSLCITCILSLFLLTNATATVTNLDPLFTTWAPTTWDGTAWSNGVPDATTDALIAGNTAPASFTCKALTINSGYSLNTTGISVTVNGDITNNGNGISGTGNLIIAANATLLGNAILFNGILTVNASATLTTSGLLTLTSNATNTARIANSAGTISGNVTVQRYIPGGRRAFRFLGHPFTTAQPLSAIADEIDITGTGGATNGFTVTATNAASAYWYNPATGNGSTSNDLAWTAFSNTNGAGANAWNKGQGIRVLIRGAKGEGLDGAAYTPGAVTLSMTGAVNQGSQVISVTKGSATTYAFVSNPFPCPVNMSLLTRAAGISSFYYTWDVNSGTKGAYSARFYSSGAILPAFASFIADISSNSSITFDEADKSTATPITVFGVNDEKNKVQLKLISADGNISWDVLQVHFNKSAANSLEENDAPKLNNPEVNLYSLSSDNKRLAIDVRPYKNDEVVAVGLSNAPTGSYTFKVDEFNIAEGIQLLLHDKFLQKQELLAEGGSYTFTITADPLSQGDNRFELLVKQPTLPVIAATQHSVMLSPNPATDMLKVSFSNETTAATTITLTAATGEKVKTVNAGNVQTGEVSINVKGLAKGIYYVTIDNGRERKTEKLQIQ